MNLILAEIAAADPSNTEPIFVVHDVILPLHESSDTEPEPSPSGEVPDPDRVTRTAVLPAAGVKVCVCDVLPSKPSAANCARLSPTPLGIGPEAAIGITMAATLAGTDFETEKAVRMTTLYVATLTALMPK